MTSAVSSSGLTVQRCSEQAGLEQWHSLHTNCTGPAQVKKRRWRWQQTVRSWWHCQQVRSSTSRVSSWKTVSAGQWYAMGGSLRARGSTPRQYIHRPAQELATCRLVVVFSLPKDLSVRLLSQT